ncbi:MAG: FAD:protein FMN transferase [Myxococcota bacterium]
MLKKITSDGIAVALALALGAALWAQEVIEKPDISTEEGKKGGEEAEDLTKTVDLFDYRNEEVKEEVKAITVTKKAPILNVLLEINAFGDDRRNTNIAVDKAIDEARRIDGLLSTYKSDTEIAQINASAGEKAVIVSAETLKIINTGLDISKKSYGAFDITWAALSDIWKFELEETPKVPTSEELAPILKLIDYKNVKVDPKRRTVFLPKKGMRIDVGGLAQGYVMERVADTLKKNGVRDFRVRIGRSVMVNGTERGRPWMIKVPDIRERRAGEIPPVPLQGKAMFTSWDGDKYFEVGGKIYHSIINPRTGYPARGVRSVTIVTDSPLEADALAIAVFVLGVKEGLRLVEQMKGVEALITDSNEVLHKSKGWDNLYQSEEEKKAPQKKGKRK